MARKRKKTRSQTKAYKKAYAKKRYAKTVKGMKLGSGERFKKGATKIAAYYRKKGKSAKKAKQIAESIMAKMGRKAHGKKAMAKWSAQGRKRK